MAIKHSLEQAWNTFKLEEEIREDLLSILNLSSQELLKLNFGYHANAPKGWTTFDIAFAEWKSSLVNQKTAPVFPTSAIDSFAIFWDKYLLEFLKSDRATLKNETLNYLRKRFQVFGSDLEIQGLIRTEEEFNDAFNLAYAKCIQKWLEPQFSLELGLVAYFKKALIHACSDIARAASAKIHYVPLDALSPESRLMIDSAMEEIEKPSLRLILDAFGKTNAKCIKVLQLAAKGFRSHEIAVQLGKTAEAIRQQLVRCKRDLKEFYNSFNS